jgi:hypothetical protein
MHTIYKYPVPLQDLSILELPTHSRILSVGLDPQGELCLWALVQPLVPSHDRWQLAVVGTGNPVSDALAQANTDASPWRFVGTVTQAPFVWHVFARGLL